MFQDFAPLPQRTVGRELLASSVLRTRRRRRQSCKRCPNLGRHAPDVVQRGLAPPQADGMGMPAARASLAVRSTGTSSSTVSSCKSHDTLATMSQSRRSMTLTCSASQTPQRVNPPLMAVHAIVQMEGGTVPLAQNCSSTRLFATLSTPSRTSNGARLPRQRRRTSRRRSSIAT